MPLTRRKKLLLGGGVLIVFALLLVVYMMQSKTPAKSTSGTTGVKPAPVSGAATPPEYIPPPPAYTPAGDSTADGTPIDGTAPVVDTAIVPISGGVPVATTPVSAPSGVSAGGSTGTVVSADSPPPAAVVVDCTVQKKAIEDYYKTKISPTLSPSMIGLAAVDSNVCDAGFQLTPIGSTAVSGVDSRRFTFTSGGLTMGGSGSGTTIQLPTVLPLPTGKIEAPPTSLITNYATYFKKFPGSVWNSASITAGISSSIEGCLKSCYDAVSCAGVNYQTATGRCTRISSGGNPVVSPDPSADFYQRLPTTTVAPVYASQIAASDTTNYMTNFAQTAGKYFATGDITSVNVPGAMDCAAACQRDYTCSGFNHWPGTYKCEMVRGYTGQVLNANSSANFYKKITPTAQPAQPVITIKQSRLPVVDGDYLGRFRKDAGTMLIDPTYVYTSAAPNTYADGVATGDLTAAACAQSCYDNIGCKAFNWSRGVQCRQIMFDAHKYATATPSGVNPDGTRDDSYSIYDAYLYSWQ